MTATADAKWFCTQRPSSTTSLPATLPSPCHVPLLSPSYPHLLGGKAWISPFPLSLALKRLLSPSHLAPLLSFPLLPCQTTMCFYSKSFLLSFPLCLPALITEPHSPHCPQSITYRIFTTAYFFLIFDCANFFVSR